jgi:ribosomal protein S18 acetylase RimI-like enzyme
MRHRRIEEASLNAWPALQQMLFDGWLLRFTKGYTKRANSVNPLCGSSMNAEEKIELCERLYAEKAQPAIFRLTPLASPGDLDHILARHRYRHIDLTSVQHLDLRSQAMQAEPSVELRHATVDNWLDTFCRLSAAPRAQHHTHQEILQAIPAKRLLAVLADSDTIVACGLGVLEHEYFGLFDLVTDPQQRNKGYGAKLVVSMLRWAQEHAAAHAYLQVMQSNAPAQHLYAKLGFEEVYQYWYRVPDA